MSKRQRTELLEQTQFNYHRANRTEQFGRIFSANTRGVGGCRVGALYFDTNVAEADSLFSVLSKGNCAAARQIFAWDFQRVAVYWEGAQIRMEADWPESLAVTDVRLNDVALYPKMRSEQRGDVWFPGINEYGELIGMWLDDTCPHVLIGGTTGAGKSVFMHSIAIQVAKNYPQTRLVFMDAKDGDGLAPIGHLRGQVAPLSVTVPQIRAALVWLVAQVKDRHTRAPRDYTERLAYRRSLRPIYGFLDEIQEVAMTYPEIAEAVRLITAMGRSAKVHLLMGTQKPLMKVFGDNLTKGNVPGRLALHTVNYKDSELIVGGEEPRADYLWPHEAWVIHPAARYCRVQLFNVTESELADAPAGPPEMEAWPHIALAEARGTLERMEVDIQPERGAAALLAAKADVGRDNYAKLLRSQGMPTFNNNKMDVYLRWARNTLRELESRWNFTLRPILEKTNGR